ncbi:MAG: DEAD/DEAH box helicase, partial [Methanomicrobiales archaeon]|nr:DEAD/DEAH box helicase [Methanomicrobiales archaeon]
MNIIVHPQKGIYKLLFMRHGAVRGVGQVSVTRTPKGWRPKNFLYKRYGKRHAHPAPTKELIAALREGSVQLTAQDPGFESFLDDFQVSHTLIDLCRICLMEDRITPFTKGEGVRYNKETVCMECAKREVRREVGYLGLFGKKSISYIEELLAMYRDVDRVLAAVQPEGLDISNTLFDRLAADVVRETASIRDLPLPAPFVSRSGVERLTPVQQKALEAGLLDGTHLLVVAATASGKTFIGEMAGMKNFLEGRGRMLFLVPLVALAHQKYQRFRERYGDILKVTLHTGVSRLNLQEMKSGAERDIHAPLVVGTYEGIDHYLRCGNSLSDIGTVVIDEVQMLEDSERGHRLDGLIARLKYIAPRAQILYLSATIGLPHLLADKLGAKLVIYSDRPVPLERHLLFVERQGKIKYIKKLVEEGYRHQSSKGFRGQSIVFTNSRARCHLIADALGKRAAPYHAGLTTQERRDVEDRFSRGSLAAVVTTAALASGVDFPASQVIFDSLAMGIEWLSVQDFHQMSGRAGRPDFHDLGRVFILAEPGASYSRERSVTEEEVAINLLRGEMEEVEPAYGVEESS